MIVYKLTKDEWSQFSDLAHLIVFNETGRSSLDKIDFALVTDVDGVPQVYCTIREIDSDTAYMQYGGAFPSAKNTTKSFQSYMMFLSRLKEMGYKQCTMLIENTNTVMLKFAIKAGLRIIGCRNIKGSILLEHLIEF